MDPFTGEIRIFGGNFAPQGWMLCNGQSLYISQYEDLFALIGTAYGGDGQQTFNLPDLRGRVPIGMGQGDRLSNYAVGQTGGADEVILQPQNLPEHTHTITASLDAANSSDPQGNLLAQSGQVSIYIQATLGTQMSPNSISTSASGGTLPHENRMPSMSLSYIICVHGLFPSR